MPPLRHRLLLALLAALTGLLLVAGTTNAHLAGDPGSGGPYEEPPDSEEINLPPTKVCPDDHPEWRNATTVYGVDVRESSQCAPDDPRLVAASVAGTNDVPQEELDEIGLHEDAVTKCCDKDGDGDPDVINITLEAIERNGWELQDDALFAPYEIAPGVEVPYWAFVPKSTIKHSGDQFEQLTQLPSVPIRMEQHDTVNLKLENTHYFPHTIHLHGTDHPFETEDGQGNDGVPHFSEAPVPPGENRTYTLTPREPGTFFFHCHVQPDVHVMMGLSTTFIVEPDVDDNRQQTFNLGGGELRAPSNYSQANYDREYDLIYQDMDKELNEIVRSTNDPRKIAEEQNRRYDSTDRSSDYFLLNGRSFPYTLRDSNIVVGPDEEVKLRVINAGEETLSLHPHGHKPIVTHLDGVELEDPYQRDAITITAAQRVDLLVNTTNDGLNSYGPGSWFMHDHREHATTTDGINPGGDITTITYESYLNESTHLPETAMPLNTFFTEEYYRGEVPVWHGLGLDSFLGQVASTEDDEEPDEAFIPAPGATLLLTLLGTLAVARGVKR